MLREVPPADLIALSASFRKADPIATNQIASIAIEVANGTRPGADVRFWLVLTGDDVSGLAMSNLSHGVLLSTSVSPADAAALGDILASSTDGHVVPEVVGTNASVQAFIESYTKSHPTSLGAFWKEDLLLYTLDNNATIDTSRFQGQMRVANAETDFDLLVQWAHDFHEYIGAPSRDTTPFVERGLKRKALFLWQVDGIPVAFGGHAAPVNLGDETIFRLVPIFVASAERRKGYGSALTAALSRHLQASCSTPSRICLYADASNPASNKAYQNVGFVLHSQVCTYGFDATAPEGP
ncbi:hypothetical protein LEN26_019016 [Aphanomyces euteiches]|nr:hypothetical protein LEN26_019016 [Aphanomyces euteiches]